MLYEWLNAGSNQWTYISSIGPFQPVANRKLSANESFKLFLIIPGNPGVCNFYEQFAECLHNRLPKSSVWAMSHFNHVLRPPELIPTSEVTLLSDQIKHKLDFVLKFVPKNAELHLIGHSIGSYIILHMLNSLIEKNGYNVKQCFLLFPTVERMAETPNGRNLMKSKSWGLHYVPFFLCYAAYFLPYNIKEWLIGRRLDCKTVPKCIFNGAAELFHWSVFSNMIGMALDEMKNVKELDVDIMKRYHDKFTILYGTKDDWCPMSYCRDMERLVENTKTKIFICDPSVEHAFVISNGLTVANMIADMM